MIKHILGWLIFTVVTVFGMPALVSPPTYKNQVLKERHELEETFGLESAQKIILSADKAYTDIFEDSGMHKSFIARYSIPEKDILENAPIKEDPLAPDPMLKYERKMQGYFVSLFISFYEWIFRTVQLIMWTTYALPFMIAAFWDGMMLRKVIAASFIPSSPAIYNGLWHAIIATFFGMNWILNLPFAIKPLLYPVVIAVFALLVRTLVSNLQRSA